jgi:phenylalanyl-tRNA synthetase beta chain
MFERARRAGVEPSHRAIEVRNPLSEDQRYLRTTLGGGLIKYFARIDAPARIFEIGHVFMSDAGGINESPVLTFGFTAEPLDEPPWHDTHFLRLKGDCEALVHAVCGIQPVSTPDVRKGLHPGKTAVLLHDGHEIATFGKVHPRVTHAFDVRLPAYLCNIYLDRLPDYRIPAYRPPSKYPSTNRDLALIVDLDVAAERIASLTKSAIGPLCVDARVFDEYRGPQVGDGRKSVAVRATIGRYDATITDEEADEAVSRALEALRSDLGATIRR